MNSTSEQAPVISIISNAISSANGSSIVVPLFKRQESNRPTLLLQLKLRNNSNRLLLYRVDGDDGEETTAALFRTRPSDVGVLSVNDAQPFDFVLNADVNWEAMTGFVIKIRTAFVVESTEQQTTIVDAAVAWRMVETGKVTTLSIPIQFIRTKPEPPHPPPVMISIEADDESPVNWSSASDVIERGWRLRDRYPDEFWVIKMLALIVIAVSMVLGYLIGSLMASAANSSQR